MKNPQLWIKLLHLDGTTHYYKVKESLGYGWGNSHRYTYNSRLQLCYEVKGYHRTYENGKTVIGQIEGNVYAVSLWGDPYPDAPGEEHVALIRTDGITRAYNSIVGKEFPWKIIIIGAVALIVIVILYMILKPDPEPLPPTDNTTAPTPTQSIDIEVR